MNVGDDLLGPLGAKPADQALGGFGREPAALPIGADDPGDRGPGPALAGDDRRLDGAHGRSVGAVAHDPVAPDLAGLAGAGSEARVALGELGATRRVPADELVQPLVGEHDCHLLGVLGRQGHQAQTLRADRRLGERPGQRRLSTHRRQRFSPSSEVTFWAQTLSSVKPPLRMRTPIAIRIPPPTPTIAR